MTTTRTRLNCGSLEAREVMSVDTLLAPLPAPVADAVPVAVAAPAAHDGIPIKASVGVTRVPPTQLDLAFMSRMENRKWQLRTAATNPFTGGTMQITAEVVFQSNGAFSLIEVGTVNTAFGPSTYRAASSGRWWVQNNGILVLRHDSTYPEGYWAKWQFMHIQAVNKARIVSPDGGTWARIPILSTGIPG